MKNELLKKFAEELKEIREQKDITLQQVFNKTRIDIKFLQAIEDANFDVMPEVYIRAFIRDYAKAIDLDPQVIIKKYELAKSGELINEDDLKNIEEEAEPQEEKPIQKEFSSGSTTTKDNTNKSSEKLVYYIVYGVGAILALVIIYFVFFNKSDEEIITETPYEEILQENKERFKVNEKEAVPDQVFSIPVDSLNLKIVSTDTCWVGVTIDQINNTDFIMYPNRTKSLKAAQLFEIVVGNAGGVEFYLNEKKLDFNGPEGARRNLTIDSKGLVTGR